MNTNIRLKLAPRKVNTKRMLKVLLIVCEGEKTEPLYFSQFKIPKEIITIEGVGANTITLVKQAIKQKAMYDQAWCVFDRDSFPKENINKAVDLARANKIKIAFSNECFELWYILHFCYIDTGIKRSQYAAILEPHIGKAYQKNDISIFKLLEKNQPNAIKNAKRLAAEYSRSKESMSDWRPYTNVHELVAELKTIEKDYSS